MKKLPKTAKTVIFAVAVPVVLAVVAVVLLIVLPKMNYNGDVAASFDLGLDEEQVVQINTKKTDDVEYLSVSNENGTFAFTRQKRAQKVEDENGETITKEEFYWTSEELFDIPQDDSTIRAFISGLAQLSGVSVVEENAEDLEKYGLNPAVATVNAGFSDGTEIKMLFGIKNPANEQTVYFRLSDSNKVYLVSYYSANYVFADARKFAALTLTESYDSDFRSILDYLRIKRSDMDSPVEIQYMTIPTEQKMDENEPALPHTYRFTSPITAEVDSAGRGSGVNGRLLCYGVFGLTANSCESVEKTPISLNKYGLDNPFAVVEFKYGGKEYSMKLSSEDAEKKVYYAVLDGVPGIYSVSRDNAPWCTFTLENLISARALSPYIYAVNYIEITTPIGVYKYEINRETKSFTCNGNAVDAENFRKLYQQLTGEIGEEVYLTQVSEEQAPEVTVKFIYYDTYEEIYNGLSDTLDFFPSDGRKCEVNINGTTLYKVSENYVIRLLENIKALNEGAEVDIEW